MLDTIKMQVVACTQVKKVTSHIYSEISQLHFYLIWKYIPWPVSGPRTLPCFAEPMHWSVTLKNVRHLIFDLWIRIASVWNQVFGEKYLSSSNLVHLVSTSQTSALHCFVAKCGTKNAFKIWKRKIMSFICGCPRLYTMQSFIMEVLFVV